MAVAGYVSVTFPFGDIGVILCVYVCVISSLVIAFNCLGTSIHNTVGTA